MIEHTWWSVCPAHSPLSDEDHPLTIRERGGSGGGLDFECENGCLPSQVAHALLELEAEWAEWLGAGKNGAGAGPAKGRCVVLTPASAITPERLQWLWRHRLPLRGLSLVAGEPGLGKSMLTVELAAAVTRGRLDGDLQGDPREVLIATAEDPFASVVWGRLTAAGADMDRVHRVHVENRDGEELLTLPHDVAEIEARCAELGAVGRPVALVVVDPVTAFLGSDWTPIATPRSGGCSRRSPRSLSASTLSWPASRI